ncbi:hypothetical protein WDW86_10525 [Bdellovibrionota bacterium FG-2]
MGFDPGRYLLLALFSKMALSASAICPVLWAASPAFTPVTLNAKIQALLPTQLKKIQPGKTKRETVQTRSPFSPTLLKSL